MALEVGGDGLDCRLYLAGVGDEATSVFGDTLGVTAADPNHSLGERRWVTVEISDRGRPLIVAHVDRSQRIRIISARALTRHEREAYEEISG